MSLNSSPYNFIRYNFEHSPRPAILATVLTEHLDEAETMFGEMISPYPYMIAGVNYGHQNIRLCFSGEGKAKQHRYLSIHLSKHSERNSIRAIWEVAYICIHLLSPVPPASVTVLEEGMACWYQQHWIESCPSVFSDKFRSKIKNHLFRKGHYSRAFDLFSKIMNFDGNALRNLRIDQPEISQITSEQLLSVLPVLTNSEAIELVSKFSEVQTDYACLR